MSYKNEKIFTQFSPMNSWKKIGNLCNNDQLHVHLPMNRKDIPKIYEIMRC